MAVDQPTDPDRLPCGNALDALLSRLRAGRPTEHERTCPHCREAAEEHRVLAEAEEQSSADEPTAPPELVDRVMRVVRAEGRSARRLELTGNGPGHTTVRENTASAILRTAGSTVPGTAVGRVRLTEEPAGVAVRLTVRLTSPVPIPETAHALRSALHRAAHEQLGWTLTRVDIDIADVD